jgi:TonB family protein
VKNLGKKVLVIGFGLMSFLSSTWAQHEEAVGDSDVKVIDYTELTYSSIARYARIQGAVVLRAKLDNEGRVVDASVISGPEVFRLDCLNNIRKWRFEPNPRKSVVVIYNFSLVDGRCKSDTSLFVLQERNLATVISCPHTAEVTSGH